MRCWNPRLLAALPLLALPVLLLGCGSEQVHGGFQDIEAPHVGFGGIANGGTIVNDTVITITAQDDESTVTNVTVFFDGLQVYTEAFASFQATISFTALAGRANAGQHTVTARAVDAENNVGESALVYTVFAP